MSKTPTTPEPTPWWRDSKWWSDHVAKMITGAVVAVVGAVVAGYLATGTTSPEPDPTPRPPSDEVAAPERTETPPSPSPTPTPMPTASAPDTPPNEPWTTEFIWTDKNYMDLDTSKASTESGREYEAYLDFGRLFNDSYFAIVDDTNVSYDACESASKVVSEVLHLSEVDDNESICIKTNLDRWAVLRIAEAEPSTSGLGTGDVTFKMAIFGDGSGSGAADLREYPGSPLEWSDGAYMDLDTGKGSVEPGREYEAYLDFGRLFNDSYFAIVDDTNVSYDACESASKVVSEVLHLSEVDDNESICIKTNLDRWAVLRIAEAETARSGLGAGDVTFDVSLFDP